MSPPPLALAVPTSRRAAPSLVASLGTVPGAVTAGCLLALALTAGKALAVWRTGVFLDPDDAMRAVEVRDWLAGQGWFDLVPHRLSPDHPFVMHWSRLVDLLLAAPLVALRAVLDADVAERLVRLAEPAALFVVFLTALAGVARRLVGAWGPLAAALLATGGLEIVGDFVPGHIHHHALQVTLLMVLARALVDGLDPARPRSMALAGLVAALTLGVNLQNMPFVAASAGLVALAWVVDGAPLARGLRGFALGLMAGTGLVFVLQVPPDRYLAQTCDAFAAPHLLAAWAGSAGLLGLGSVPALARGSWRRLAAAAASGILVLVLVRMSYPACLGDPYAAVDPLLRAKWLNEVGEAMPLSALLARDPAGTLPIAVTLALGLAACGAAVLGSEGLERRRWLAVTVLGAVAVLGACWEVRVAASAEALLALGAAWVLCRRVVPAWGGRPLGTVLVFLCGFAFTQAGWTAVLPARLFGTAIPAALARTWPAVDPDACFEPSSYATLATLLPHGRVLSGIDVGSHILAHTSHDVFAASYHRDAAGNRLALLAFPADVDAAERLVRDAGATVLAFCVTSPEIQEFALQNPDGLAARIMGGRPPAWLAPVPPDAGPMRVFRVAPPEPPRQD